MVRGSRLVAGLAAMVALAGLAWSHSDFRQVSGAAVVDAGKTFTVTEIEPGRFSWRLDSGRPAMGPGVSAESSIEVARSELTVLRVPDDLNTGDQVRVGDVVVEIGSSTADALVGDLTAQRARLVADKDLLLAGGRAETVAAAKQGVTVAEARLVEEQTVLKRLQGLVGNAGVAQAEVDAARDRVATRESEVAAARAAVRTAQLPPRPEELAAVDARIASVDAKLAEAQSRVDSQTITSPVAGVLEIGGPSMLRVYALDPVYVRGTLPESARATLRPGARLAWRTKSMPDRVFSATVAEVAESIVSVDGHAMVYVSAEVSNADLALRPGMSGTLVIEDVGQAVGAPVAVGPSGGEPQ
jgi:HlyD family secretion protein